MRRTIDAILDPWPADVGPIWEYFDSTCAYCGITLDREAREGHIDHAVSGAGNHLGNLILACATCNGDEKLGGDWAAFLTRKIADPDLRAQRQACIEHWMTMHPPSPWTPSPEVEALVEQLDALVDDFGVRCAELRTRVRVERQSAEANSQP